MQKMKGILLSILLIGCVTGCGEKKLTCTKEEDIDGVKTNYQVEIRSVDNKVTYVSQKEVVETFDEDLGESISFGQSMADEFNKIDGVHMEIKKTDDNHIETTIEIDYTKINKEQAKDLLQEDYVEEDFKEMTVDEFKEKNLEGFQCK